MKISEILRKAADGFLWTGEQRDSDNRYSCGAVADVTDQKVDDSAACNFLMELGVDTWSYHAFDEFPEGEIRQGARFLWLDFAALVAEDEGL